jgi:hypothetical protein
MQTVPLEHGSLTSFFLDAALLVQDMGLVWLSRLESPLLSVLPPSLWFMAKQRTISLPAIPFLFGSSP